MREGKPEAQETPLFHQFPRTVHLNRADITHAVIKFYLLTAGQRLHTEEF